MYAGHARHSSACKKARFTNAKKPSLKAWLFYFSGSSTWARTRDLRINSPALYRLSYRGITRVATCCSLEKHQVLKLGSSTWARTRDLRINSPALYRLSYRGTEARIVGSAHVCVKPLRRFFSSFSVPAPPAPDLVRSVLEHLRDRLSDVTDVFGVQRGQADATGRHRIDAEVRPELFHLISA